MESCVAVTTVLLEPAPGAESALRIPPPAGAKPGVETRPPPHHPSPQSRRRDRPASPLSAGPPFPSAPSLPPQYLPEYQLQPVPYRHPRAGRGISLPVRAVLLEIDRPISAEHP